ncbi:hypothetical protein M408DRAFT_55513, partial [Serendipita vermifera MAFF 305830]
ATHPSTSRKCPAFLRKQGILHARNPEYALPYFQTEDDWTWEQPQAPKPFPTQQTVTASATTKKNAPAGTQQKARLRQTQLSFQ